MFFKHFWHRIFDHIKFCFWIFHKKELDSRLGAVTKNKISPIVCVCTVLGTTPTVRAAVFISTSDGLCNGMNEACYLPPPNSVAISLIYLSLCFWNFYSAIPGWFRGSVLVCESKRLCHMAAAKIYAESYHQRTWFPLHCSRRVKRIAVVLLWLYAEMCCG